MQSLRRIVQLFCFALLPLRSLAASDIDTLKAAIVEADKQKRTAVTRPWIYEEKYHPTNWVASECLDFLRRRDRSKPFFLMASFVRPHPPLDAPQCYADLYRNKDLRPPVRGDWNDEARRDRKR